MMFFSLIFRGFLILSVSIAVLVETMVFAGRARPSRNQIAYISGEPPFVTYINLMDVDTRLSHRISGDDLILGSCCLSWSPDGKSLAVVSRTRPPSIYIIDVESLKLRRLTRSLPYDWSPRFSPDGKRIAFVSRRDSSNDLPYIMDADGANQSRLASRGNQTVWWPPTWSMDGSKLILLDDSNVLVAHNLNPQCNKTCSEPLLPSNLGILPTTALRQIDDRRLLIAAFSGDDYRDFGIYILDRFAPNTLERLTTNSGVFPPSMAASRNWVAFVSGESNPETTSIYNHLYLLDTNCVGTSTGCASKLQQVDVELTIDSGLAVSWSPDGRWLTFIGAAQDEGIFQLHMLDTDCARQGQNCTDFVQPLTQGFNWISSPAWRP